mgnify:FL=1
MTEKKERWHHFTLDIDMTKGVMLKEGQLGHGGELQRLLEEVGEQLIDYAESETYADGVVTNRVVQVLDHESTPVGKWSIQRDEL